MDLCSKTWNVCYETRSIYTNVSTAKTTEGYIIWEKKTKVLKMEKPVSFSDQQ